MVVECTGKIKELLDVDSLLDKSVEKRMINDKEKKRILGESNRDKKMEEFLFIIKASIKEVGNDFDLFIKIIKEENTRRADELIKILSEKYTELAGNNVG